MAGNIQPQLDKSEHEGTLMPPTKRVLLYGYDGSTKNVLKIDSSGSLKTDSGYNVNHIDDTTTTNVVYICMEDSGGTWVIKKIDSTGSFPVFTYATITNNPTLTTYTLAYTARATTAVYDIYSVAF